MATAPAKQRIPADDPVDQQDVPAAVVCALCGLADCTGCGADEGQSGVIAIVPWERDATPFWKRLWATSHASVFEPEQFFGLLPDGPLGKPFLFAVTSELLAVAAMATCGTFVISTLFPLWAHQVLIREPIRVAKLFGTMIPATTALLVAAHVAHGLALDQGTRLSGARPQPTRALRFGLYTSGWDLTVGPLGALRALRGGGFVRALRLLSGVQTRGLITRSTVAFSRQTYNLGAEAAKRPMLVALLAAGLTTVVGATGLCALGVYIWFF